MSGKVPPSSRADKRIATSNDVDRAAALYERFTGQDAEGIGYLDVPKLPAAVAVIGECDAVQYTTVRDGRVERYEHRFTHSDKPLLCVSPDGGQLLLLGGRYVFTERGIVDLSDSKNLPAGFRKQRRATR